MTAKFLTDANIEETLKGKNIGGVYVTPQHFGAKGDGVTDDTAAFNNAIATGKTVKIPEGSYCINGTINMVNGAAIEGSKNSVLLAYAPTVFHLAQRNTLSGFTIRVRSSSVLTVFEVDDNSITSDALMWDRIVNVDVYHATEDTPPEMFTVCHFHNDVKGMYDILVRDCTFVCGKTGGYVARVYSGVDGECWTNGITFENCNTRSFKWHYFFANNDKDLIAGKSNEGHLVSGCVAQCTTETNGFIFATHELTVMLRGNKPWDWGSGDSGSKNCFGTPFVLNKSFLTAKAKTTIFNEFGDVEEICFYDGSAFYTSGMLRKMNVQERLGVKYDTKLIPKVTAIDMAKCVLLYDHGLYTGGNLSNDTKIRFYLIDGCGVTYVSIILESKRVRVSQPMRDGYKIGMSLDGQRFYLYRTDGYNITANTAILSMPVPNSSKMYASSSGNAVNTEKTADVYRDPDARMFNELPEEIEELPCLLAQPAYISDDNGRIYALKVATADDGTRSLSFARAWAPESE